MTQYKNMFAGVQQEPKKPATSNFKGMAAQLREVVNSNLTPTQKKITSLGFNLIIEPWVVDFDKQIENLSLSQQHQSQEYFNICEGVAKFNDKNHKCFDGILGLMKSLEESISDRTEITLGIFKKVIKGEPLTIEKISEIKRQIDPLLDGIVPDLDMFTRSKMHALSEQSQALLKRMDQGILSLEYFKKSGELDDDQINRRKERILTMKQLLQLNIVSMDELTNKIEDRRESLKDFKMTAIPGIMYQLQQQINNLGDPKALMASIHKFKI